MNELSPSIGFDELPWRWFLDTNTLQILDKYGEYIFDGGELHARDRMRQVTNGVQNLEALRNIWIAGSRGSIELVVSEHTFKEVGDSNNYSHWRWAHEILGHWMTVLESYDEHGESPFDGSGMQHAAKLNHPSIGYLSDKDKALLKDALEMECHAFITTDRRLVNATAHLQRGIPMKILEPTGVWALFRPWSGLF